MVSNKDTTTRVDTQTDLHNEVLNQSKEEILDYLVGVGAGNEDFISHEIEEVQEVQENYHEQEVEAETETTEVVSSIQEETELSNSSAMFKAFGWLKEVKSCIDEADNISNAMFLQIFKDLKPILDEIKINFQNLTQESSGFAYDNLVNFDVYCNSKLPNYKRKLIGAIVLALCSISSVINQTALPVSSGNDNLLESRRLAAVNWNVNGQVNDLEKDSLKKLISSGNIKIVPKQNSSSNGVQLISSLDDIDNNEASPDSSLMLIRENVIQHEISTGESILSISKKYKVSVSELITYNPNADLINLKPGDKVIVPNNEEPGDSSNSPSGYYSKIPRNMIASRSLSSFSRLGFDSLSGNGADGKFIWPVLGSKTISSPFGARWGSFHPGIDISATLGMPIIAAKDGVVSSSGWAGGYGKSILIDHGNGITTRYAHASALYVQPGEKVTAGQIIGRVGSTGRSTGPHLHFEVLISGKHENPVYYL